jgi:hypothetical protein
VTFPLDTFKLFQAKAGCAHSQQRARRLWAEIKPYLTEDEQRWIGVAWGHHLIGEGRGELDEVCGEVIDTRKRKENR